MFKIFEESDWQDREDVGHEILEHLLIKRKDLIIDLDDSFRVNNSDEKS